MSDNIAWLIQDIGKLDGHRHNKTEELKVLRIITLFDNERHPELHVTVTPATQQEGTTQRPTRQHGNTTTTEDPGHLATPTDGDRETKKTI